MEYRLAHRDSDFGWRLDEDTFVSENHALKASGRRLPACPVVGMSAGKAYEVFNLSPEDVPELLDALEAAGDIERLT
jgi:hypothetical protein